MSRVLLAYSTVDGHTRTICERLAARLREAGHEATLLSLADPERADLAAFDRIVIGASIRYGRHRPELYAFIAAQRPLLDRRPSAFFSVNVVARKPGKDTPQGNPYLRDFLKRTTWRPRALAVFAGKIDYRRYGLFDREVVRMIMRLTRGPTARDACVEFTDWDAVDAFAHRIGAM